MSLLMHRYARIAVCLSLLGAVSGVRTAWSHPIHTTLTEVSLASVGGEMQITIRAFADDFSAAVSKHARKPRPSDFNVSDADIIAYVSSAVSVESSGRNAPLVWSGSRRAGDVIWVTFKVPSVHALRDVKVALSLLFDLYEDQVNIVQATASGRRRSMLFTTGDGRKFKSLE